MKENTKYKHTNTDKSTHS